jgi:hypothetical protein
MNLVSSGPKPFGVVAEFDDPDTLVAAAEKAREAGYKRMDAYTPFPIHGLSEILHFRDERVPVLMLLGGIAGGFFGFLLQAYTSAVDLPTNVGGKPMVSVPAFIPVTFETTVLFSAITGVVSMLFLNGFPKPYDPVFNAPNFERASQDRFFLAVEAHDPNYDPDEIIKFFEGVGAEQASEVHG